MKVVPQMVGKAKADDCVATVKLISGAGFTMTTSTGVHEITEVGGCGCVTKGGGWKVLDPAACPVLFAEAAGSNPTITTGGGGCTQVTKNQPCQ